MSAEQCAHRFNGACDKCAGTESRAVEYREVAESLAAHMAPDPRDARIAELEASLGCARTALDESVELLGEANARIAELEQRRRELQDMFQPWRDANAQKAERIAELESRVAQLLKDAHDEPNV